MKAVNIECPRCNSHSVVETLGSNKPTIDEMLSGRKPKSFLIWKCLKCNWSKRVE
jgi:RNase P subunit RPR2